jgi:hypothetical protein
METTKFLNLYFCPKIHCQGGSNKQVYNLNPGTIVNEQFEPENIGLLGHLEGVRRLKQRRGNDEDE